MALGPAIPSRAWRGGALVLLALAIACFLLALLPGALFAANVSLFRRLPCAAGVIPISVLIPARNEERSIVAAVESVLANAGAEFEVIVLDDCSDDSTPDLVRDLARKDRRVRLETAPPLPLGWCGKQHACQVLAGLARHELLAWMDADVRLAPDALARMATWMHDHPNVGLLSGFPRQEMGTFLERLLIPLIHFVLLGFLPLARMRASTEPSLGAGCGQLFVARRSEYLRAGGHSAIASSLHDGIMLPRVFRRAGIATDLFDATDVANCRMYHSSVDTWLGLAKNATEGMGAPRAIGVWTILLFGGQVMPVILLAIGLPHRPGVVALSAAAVALSIGVRTVAARKYRQPFAFILLHPPAIVGLLAVQWYALGRKALGISASWKGRQYGAERSEFKL